MRKYMVQIDLADQSMIGVHDETGVTLAFASGPFERRRFFTRKGAERYAAEQTQPTKVFKMGWGPL